MFHLIRQRTSVRAFPKRALSPRSSCFPLERASPFWEAQDRRLPHRFSSRGFTPNPPVRESVEGKKLPHLSGLSRRVAPTSFVTTRFGLGEVLAPPSPLGILPGVTTEAPPPDTPLHRPRSDPHHPADGHIPGSFLEPFTRRLTKSKLPWRFRGPHRTNPKKFFLLRAFFPGVPARTAHSVRPSFSVT